MTYENDILVKSSCGENRVNAQKIAAGPDFGGDFAKVCKKKGATP